MIGNELIDVIAMDSPWDAADKHYPGGFKQYFQDMFCPDSNITVIKYE